MIGYVVGDISWEFARFLQFFLLIILVGGNVVARCIPIGSRFDIPILLPLSYICVGAQLPISAMCQVLQRHEQRRALHFLQSLYAIFSQG